MSAIAQVSGRRKQRIGTVVSDSMNKTRAVEVTTLNRHDLYQKVRRQKRRFYAHDEGNASKVGDRVLMEETRPLSKLKRWRILEILKKGA